MNNELTIEKMKIMKLNGMARAFETSIKSLDLHNFTQDEIVAHLVEAEYDERYNRKLKRLVDYAKFRYQAFFEELNFSETRNINKNMMLRFSDCNWIKKGENIIITGSTGVGKSYIACALGHQTCIHGFKVLYMNCLKLFTQLKYSKADGSYTDEMNKIKKQDLIILDDFGLEVMDLQSRLTLLEIIEDRHGNKSTIITSQLPIKNWHEIIGDPTIADAICDRLIHQSHKIELKGESMRKK